MYTEGRLAGHLEGRGFSFGRLAGHSEGRGFSLGRLAGTKVPALLAIVPVLLIALLLAMPALAQQAMPDAGQMAGVPLPAGDLPDRAVSVRVVRVQMGNNVSGQAVTLMVAGEARTAVTDQQGRAQFDGIPSGTAVTASANVDGEALVSQAFEVPAAGGIRVALVAGLAGAAAAEQAAAAKEPPRKGVVEFGGETRFVLEYQDDRLQVFYLLEVVNNAGAPIDIGGPLLIELPRGASGSAMLQGSTTQASAQGEIVTVTGPFPPGKTMVQVGFTLPDAGSTLQIRQKMPAALEQVFVAVEKIGPMQMSSPQFTGSREMNAEGQIFLMGTGGRLNAGDTLAIDLTGLPSHSTTPRNAALALAILILGVGLWLAFTPGEAHVAAVARLQKQRTRLMGDLVGLERKRRHHELSAADEAKRQRLLADLERVVAELDQAPSTGDEGVAA